MIRINLVSRARSPHSWREQPCSVEGCGRLVGEKGCGGLCRDHAEKLRLTGDPRGAREARRDAYLGAAHAYVDRPHPAALLRLATAAVAWASLTRVMLYERAELERAASLVPSVLHSAAVRELAAASVAYSEHDAEAPLASFEEVALRLDVAAGKVFKALGLSLRPDVAARAAIATAARLAGVA